MPSDLRKIPSVGKKTEEVLIQMGYPTIQSLQGANPQALYEQNCLLKGEQVDRCQLYVYRCAVYFANTKHPDPQKLKWWYWKD